MTDIAQLGIAIDSSQTVTAKANLTALAAAAKPAETAFNALSAAAAKTTSTTNANNLSLRGQHQVLAGLANDLSILSPQLGATAQAASALYVGNSHLIEGYGSLGGALKALLTPTTLLVGGFAALVLGTYAANSAWKAAAEQLDNASKSADVTIQRMSALQDAAAFKGIDTKTFSDSMQKLAGDVYAAQNNMGGLALLLRANGQSAGDFETTLGKVADLIKNASSYQEKIQLLQQAGLPATAQWVQFMSQGAAGIKAATDSAVQLSPAEQALVDRAKDFDDKWNAAWRNFKSAAFSAITYVKAEIDTIANLSNSLHQYFNPSDANARVATSFSDVNSGFSNNALQSALQNKATQLAGGSSKPTVDYQAVAKAIAEQQQYLGLLGQTASIQQVIQGVTLQIAQYENQPGAIAITKAKADALKQLAADSALGLAAIRQQTDAMNVEIATVGMSAGGIASYTAETNALNDARRNGRVLTDANVAAIHQEATALGQAAQQADTLKFSFDTYQGFFRDFETGLRNGQTVWQSFAAAGTNALGKISDKLMDMATSNLWNAAFGGKSGGGGLFGSLFSSLFPSSPGGGVLPNGAALGGAGGGIGMAHSGAIVGSESSGTKYIHPAYFDDAPRFHTGGLVADEVPIIAKKGEGVFTAAQMKALAPVGAGGSSAPPVTITNYNDFSGADPGSEARIKAYVDSSSRAAVQQAVQAVQKAYASNTAYLKGRT